MKTTKKSVVANRKAGKLPDRKDGKKNLAKAMKVFKKK
jgi:hypothetical protein